MTPEPLEFETSSKNKLLRQQRRWHLERERARRGQPPLVAIAGQRVELAERSTPLSGLRRLLAAVRGS